MATLCATKLAQFLRSAHRARCCVLCGCQEQILQPHEMTWTVFVAEMQCVYCTVWTESLRNLGKFWFLNGCAVPQAAFVGLSPQRPEFDPRLIHVRFVVEKVTLQQFCTEVLLFFAVNTIPPMLQLSFSFTCCCCQKDKRAKTETFHKGMLSRKLESGGWKKGL